MICIGGGGACKGKKEKGFFSVAFHSFFPCVKIHLSLADLFNVSCTTAVCCSAGGSVGVLPGTFLPRWRLALSGRAKDEGLTLSEYR